MFTVYSRLNDELYGEISNERGVTPTFPTIVLVS